MNELREYSGTWLATVTDDTREQLLDAALTAGVGIDVGNTYVEFEYRGRDTNRFVVRFLTQAAALLGNAQGEIECVTASDTGDDAFEFFTVADGVLRRQHGRIVRGPVEVVRDAG